MDYPTPKLRWASALTIFAFSAMLGGCGNDPDAPVATSQSAASATAEAATAAPDPTFLRNMAAMQKQPGPTDLAWRQPKELVAGLAPALQPSAPEVTPPSSPALTEALSAAVDYHRSRSGLGLMVWHDGQLIGQDLTDDFRIDQHVATFSMHKSVLALAMLAALEDGIIESLDDRVGSYIPQWADDPRGDITLRHLLTHTSGLKHFAMGGDSPRAANLALSSKISETALTYPQETAPGERFSYANVNSQLVGIALENALEKSGQRYADYLSARIWKPLGNSAANLWLEAEGGSPRYFSGLEAGLADWLRIGQLLLNNGKVGDTQILSPESMAMLISPSPANPAYGLHMWLGNAWQAQRPYGPDTPVVVPHAEPYLAPDVWYFDGFGGQRVYVAPSAALVVTRAGAVDMAYDDSVIVNHLLRGLQQSKIDQAAAVYDEEGPNAIYAERFAQLQREAKEGRGLAGYDPVVSLPGAESVTPLPRDSASADWLDSDARQWLDSFGEGNNSSAIMVWHKGNIIYENYFAGNTAQSLIITRSLSKPISIMAMGRALKLGYIQSLEQPVDEFLTEWQGSDKSSMTLRHLLQMRSGLARQGQSMEPESYLNRAYLHPYHIEVILHQYPMEHPPGTRYDYSNANSELVAPIIERATGRRYEDWVGEAVFKPLGAAGGQIWVNRPGGTVHSGCCAMLPAETILRLSVLIINDGVWNGERLLPEGYVKEITSSTQYNPHTGMGMYVAGPYVTNRGAANPDVPYGHTLHSEPYLDKDLYLFDGNGHQVSYHVPRHDLIIMRLGVRPPKEVTWDNAELPNYVLRQYAEATGAELVPQAAP